MARVKITSSDINAKLAKGECANYRSNGCQGRQPCTVVNGEACVYFNTYVKPLLDYPDCMAKYGREAKISVALNPKSKVVRKRRQANEPALAVNPPPAAPLPTAHIKSKPAVQQAGASPIVPPQTRQTPAIAAAAPKRLPALSKAKEALLLPVDQPLTGEKKTPAMIHVPPMAKPAILPLKENQQSPPPSPTPPANSAAAAKISPTGKEPAQPLLTLTTAAPPAAKRHLHPVKAADIITVSAVTTVAASRHSGKTAANPEQPQLFGDLFAD